MQFHNASFFRFLKQIYRKAKKERQDLITKYNHTNDPIRQESSRYEPKKKNKKRLVEEYNIRMAQKPERLHKTVEYTKTDLFQTVEEKEQKQIFSNRTFFRVQQEINSKIQKPQGIKTHYPHDRYRSGVAEVIHTDPNTINNDLHYSRKSKRFFSSLDTFDRLFSRGKTVSPQKQENKINIISIRYPKMKADHLKELFANQEKFNDFDKDKDIAIKPNNLEYRFVTENSRLKKLNINKIN